MRHYSKAEWQSLIDNNSDSLLQEEMQEHLMSCNNCMALYTELMDEVSYKDMSLPDSFTDKVMELIHTEIAKSERKKLKQRRINMFIYYASAASITLFLVHADVFQSIYQSFTTDPKYVSETSQKQSLFTNGWTFRLADETTKFINDLISKKST